MPRPRLQIQAPQLSPGQASYVLDKLVADRRISVGEINRYVSDMHREISELESRLNSLRSAAGTGTGGGLAAPVRRRPGRPRKVVAPMAAFPAAVPARRGRRPGRPSNASLGIVSAAAAPAPRRRGRRARSAITPQQLASRQLQGRYLGLIRQIPASRRGQYQRIAKEQSREAAIREMESVLKK